LKKKPCFSTPHRDLYDIDCLQFLRGLPQDVAQTFFPDPPFNLQKDYGPLIRDKEDDSEYVNWCKEWFNEASRIVRPGGAIFVYNLPKWNMLLGAYLYDQGLMFRHSIAIEHESSLPITGRLYPAHYSLLYFTKGKPNRFQRIRTPIETCRHCAGEIKDYRRASKGNEYQRRNS
jgi:site-specific DNA-methyltransferase (adenine-specific)